MRELLLMKCSEYLVITVKCQIFWILKYLVLCCFVPYSHNFVSNNNSTYNFVSNFKLTFVLLIMDIIDSFYWKCSIKIKCFCFACCCERNEGTTQIQLFISFDTISLTIDSFIIFHNIYKARGAFFSQHFNMKSIIAIFHVEWVTFSILKSILHAHCCLIWKMWRGKESIENEIFESILLRYRTDTVSMFWM